jgi:hypothetical protein
VRKLALIGRKHRIQLLTGVRPDLVLGQHEVSACHRSWTRYEQPEYSFMLALKDRTGLLGLIGAQIQAV